MAIPDTQEAQRALLKKLTENIEDTAIKQAVDRILSSRSTLEEKLSAVIGLTNESSFVHESTTNEEISDELNAPAEEDSESSPHNVEPDTPISGIRDILKNRKKIKPPIEEANLFSYLFEDIWKIIPFIRETGLIEGKLFYLILRCSANHIDVYSISLQKRTLVPLQEFLRLTLNKGWIFLTKKEFNLLALLRSLVERVLTIDFVHLPYTDRDIGDHLIEIEQLYLSLRSISQDLNDFTSAIRKCFQNMPDLPGSVSSTHTLIQRVLSLNVLTPSLEQLVLAVNIVKYRRYVEFSDLIREDPGILLSVDEFDAPDNIQAEIRRYLKETESKLASLVKRRNVLINTDQNNQDNENNLAELQFFYSFGDDLLQQAQDLLDPKKRGLQEQESSKGNFLRDQNLPLVFTIRFIQRFIQTSKSLLTGTVPLSVGVQRLFAKDLFGYYFEKIEESQVLLLECLKLMPTFNQNQYNDAKHASQENLSDINKKLLTSLDSVLQPLLMIHGLLQKIIQKHVSPAPSIKPGPVTIRQTTGESLSIPFSQEFVDQRDVLMGKTVSEALFSIHDVLTQFLVIMQPDVSTIRSSGVEDLERDIFALTKMVKRIGTREYYQSIRKKYKLTN